MPTRIRNSYSLIDNIYTNVTDVQITNGLLIEDLSDHLPIFSLISYAINSSFSDKTKVKYTRKMTENNLNAFIRSLRDQDWNDVLLHTNIEQSYSKFVDCFLDKFQSHFPLVKTKDNHKNSYSPWFTPGLKNACKKRTIATNFFFFF